ncbi:hypothetical protein EVAR_69380_1 [Eumeta japonica]|uniref:Uncharacterized protein n=1 Tax=Eumeta variegata TaxID=151549 RepID=A0A4C1SJ08_EUMVA|nr:hypothetical protein EVAR_69380_1 [Eumeta japonica]
MRRFSTQRRSTTSNQLEADNFSDSQNKPAGLQNYPTTHHHVTAEKAPQPWLAEFSLKNQLGLPTPMVLGILPSEDSAANYLPRLS